MEQICSFWGNIAKAMDIFLYGSVNPNLNLFWLNTSYFWMRNDLYYPTRRALSQLDGQCALVFLFVAPLSVCRSCQIKKGTENFISIAYNKTTFVSGKKK